jgi:hypothetical protein
VSTGDPAIDSAFNAPGPSPNSNTATGDSAIDSAFASRAVQGETDLEKLHDAEAQHDVMGQQPMDVSALPHPWASLGRMAVGAATDLVGLVPFAGQGMADAIRRHTQNIQPQGQAEQIGAAGIDASLPLLTMGIGKAPEKPAPLQEALNSQYANSPQSMGAAATAPKIADLPAPIRDTVQTGIANGETLNQAAIQNHADAEKFGVHLMEGQATRDPDKFSNEQNSNNPAVTSRINKQDEAMVNGLDDIRGEAGPTTVQNNPRENGQIVVDSLKAYDEPKVAAIDQAYQSYRDSTGGNANLDSSQFAQNVTNALKPGNQSKFLPPTVSSIVDDISKSGGKLSLDDFEAYTKQLSAESAKAAAARDGNAMHAIGQVRQQVESLEPTSDQSATSVGLYRDARTLAQNRFDEMDADPAYAAAVHDVQDGTPKGKPSALADTFLDNNVLSKTAPKVQVDAMLSKLDPQAKEAVASHTLSAIRSAAIGPNGNIRPAGYNGAMQKYADKMSSIVQPQTQEDLEALGRTITNAKVAPPGNNVNYSKSGVVINAAKGVGSELGAAAINAKTFGLGVPLIKGIAEKNWADKTLAPGAGIRP